MIHDQSVIDHDVQGQPHVIQWACWPRWRRMTMDILFLFQFQSSSNLDSHPASPMASEAWLASRLDRKWSSVISREHSQGYLVRVPCSSRDPFSLPILLEIDFEDWRMQRASIWHSDIEYQSKDPLLLWWPCAMVDPICWIEASRVRKQSLQAHGSIAFAWPIRHIEHFPCKDTRDHPFLTDLAGFGWSMPWD